MSDMQEIIERQRLLQSRYATLEDYPLPNPSELEGKTIGEVREYILLMRDFLNDEVQEVVLALADDDRRINKPWSTEFKKINSTQYTISDKIRGEAIDMFCFALNIMIACGINEQNIREEYDKVLSKNHARINDKY